MVDDRPVQLINEARDFRLTVIELRETSLEEKEATAARLAAEEAEKTFNLAEGPLLRVKLLRLAADDHVLLITMHHIISDGWSIKVLIRELGSSMKPTQTNGTPRLPTCRFITPISLPGRETGCRVTDSKSNSLYWKAHLAGAPLLLELPTDRPRPRFKTFYGADLRLSFSKALTEDIARLSRREGATLFMTLLAAFATLLYRYSGQRDVLVGTPIANRNRAETENLIGFSYQHARSCVRVSRTR